MPRGNRLFVVTAVGLAAIVGSAVAVYQFDNPVAGARGADGNGGPARHEPAADRIARALEAIEHAQSSPENAEHERRDLDAQEGAWRWTKWAAWAGFIQLILTVFGFGFVVQSLRQATNAERPHVRFYRTIRTEPEGRKRSIVLGINFRNYGRTPALVKSLTIDFALADKPPKPSDAVSIRTFSEDMVIPQDEGWPRNYYISGWKGGPDLKKLVAGHKPTGPRLFVYGIMIYEDAFGISRRTEFCRVFDGKGFTYNQGDVDPLNKAT